MISQAGLWWTAGVFWVVCTLDGESQGVVRLLFQAEQWWRIETQLWTLGQENLLLIPGPVTYSLCGRVTSFD